MAKIWHLWPTITMVYQINVCPNNLEVFWGICPLLASWKGMRGLILVVLLREYCMGWRIKKLYFCFHNPTNYSWLSLIIIISPSLSSYMYHYIVQGAILLHINVNVLLWTIGHAPYHPRGENYFMDCWLQIMFSLIHHYYAIVSTYIEV